MNQLRREAVTNLLDDLRDIQWRLHAIRVNEQSDIEHPDHLPGEKGSETALTGLQSASDALDQVLISLVGAIA